jgi:nucleoside-diphosphate-sugar epimerase
MKVLVTGTDGYIGSQLAPLLVERGHEVTGFDTGFYREGWLYNNGIVKFPSWLSKDVRLVSGNDLAGFDAVVHLAELSNDPLGQLNPDITYEINHKSTVELAKRCKRLGIQRFIYTSSCSVYGTGSGEFKDEESAPNPQTAYAQCKILVETGLAQLADADFSPTFLRNATAYGPSPRMRFDLVLNNLAGSAWTTKEIKMTSDGSPWRPLVHVLDICEAIACCLTAPRQAVHKQIFNVGDSKENYQVRDIAQIVAEAVPGCKLIFGMRDGDNRSYRVRFDKIHSQLPGFRCRRNAAMGAAELVSVFERIGMSKQTFEFRAYTRLEQLQHLLRTHQIDDHLYWRQT